MTHRLFAVAMVVAALIGSSPVDAASVTINIVEQNTQKPIPARVHLKDSAGRALRAEGQPFFRDHFVCAGVVKLDLPAGEYSYEVERGPEYAVKSGSFQVDGNGAADVRVELKRLVDLSSQGWWSGELHVHRPIEEIELLMQAEDLHVAPVITWWQNRRSVQSLWTTGKMIPENPLVNFDGNRFYQVLAGEDEREGGALLFFHLRRPISLANVGPEFPSPLKFVEEARKHPGVWIDVEKPFWWDVPVWLASGQVDSMGLANNHMCRSQMYETEAWGKPRDVNRLPVPRGNGFWTQEIYYQVLNCGLRIPPSAGSASGVLPNPVGYNRMYVHVAGPFTHEKWWEGFRAGRLFVTNGPLLRVRANGELPGHIFAGRDGKAVEVSLQAEFDSRDDVRALEIIKNGRVEKTVSLTEGANPRDLGQIQFSTSGWFLVRAIADNLRTFRFASTAPFYVEIGDTKRRVSKTSAQFFRDWVEERLARVKVENMAQRDEVLKYHLQARKFWEEILANATAD